MIWVALLIICVIVSLTHVTASPVCYSVRGVAGQCLDSSITQCRYGPFEPGRCDSSLNADVQCCAPAKCTNAEGKSGLCISTTTGSCDGTWESGLCFGVASDVSCCVFADQPGIQFLPPPPNPALSEGSCTTPNGTFSGICMSASECTGATFNDRCPQRNGARCCVGETRSLFLIPPKFQDSDRLVDARTGFMAFDQESFESLFPTISLARGRALQPYFDEAISQVQLGATDRREACYRAAAYVAQVGHESLRLQLFEEIASGEAYEMNAALGNTQVGDGPRYKGRGPLQLRGRKAYREASSAVSLDLEANPIMAAFPSIGFRTANWIWLQRELNQYATSDPEDFRLLTIALIGQPLGMESRTTLWEEAKSILGCANIAPGFSITRPPVPAIVDPPTGPPSTDGISNNDGTENAGWYVALSLGTVGLGALLAIGWRKRSDTIHHPELVTASVVSGPTGMAPSRNNTTGRSAPRSHRTEISTTKSNRTGNKTGTSKSGAGRSTAGTVPQWTPPPSSDSGILSKFREKLNIFRSATSTVTSDVSAGSQSTFGRRSIMDYVNGFKTGGREPTDSFRDAQSIQQKRDYRWSEA